MPFGSDTELGLGVGLGLGLELTLGLGLGLGLGLEAELGFAAHLLDSRFQTLGNVGIQCYSSITLHF